MPIPKQDKLNLDGNNQGIRKSLTLDSPNTKFPSTDKPTSVAIKPQISKPQEPPLTDDSVDSVKEENLTSLSSLPDPFARPKPLSKAAPLAPI